jgi:hypothetical protein
MGGWEMTTHMGSLKRPVKTLALVTEGSNIKLRIFKEDGELVEYKLTKDDCRWLVASLAQRIR